MKIYEPYFMTIPPVRPYLRLAETTADSARQRVPEEKITVNDKPTSHFPQLLSALVGLILYFLFS